MLELFFNGIAGLGLTAENGEFLWLWPWAFWLLPLPLSGLLLPAAQAPNQQAVALPFWSDLAQGAKQQSSSRWLLRILAWLMWFLFPHHVNYHIEHHLLPSIPHYNLPRCHAELAAAGALDRAEVRRFGSSLARVLADPAPA